jgi:uncharacterized protein (DUF2384 family)
MATDTAAFFGTVPEDRLHLIDQGTPKMDRIAKLLEFRDKDIARATGFPRAAINLEKHKVPPEVSERILQWTQALNLVAQFFSGDEAKTVLWFRTPNPLLGGVEPRDMIRIGRFQRLYLFIRDALSDLPPAEERPQ